MNILSQDGKILVNHDNIASLYIQKIYRQYAHPDTWWEIRAMYSAVSEDCLYDTIAKFDDEKECESVFKRIVNEICKQKLDLVMI